MRNFEINRVATCGCEITNENNQIIGWSVDGEWGRIMAEALLNYFKEKENEKRDNDIQFTSTSGNVRKI